MNNFPLQIMLDIDTVNMIQHFVDSVCQLILTGC